MSFTKRQIEDFRDGITSGGLLSAPPTGSEVIALCTQLLETMQQRDARPDVSPDEAACVTVAISLKRPDHVAADMERGQQVREKLLIHAHKSDRPASQMPSYR